MCLFIRLFFSNEIVKTSVVLNMSKIKVLLRLIIQRENKIPIGISADIDKMCDYRLIYRKVNVVVLNIFNPEIYKQYEIPTMQKKKNVI